MSFPTRISHKELKKAGLKLKETDDMVLTRMLADSIATSIDAEITRDLEAARR